MTNREIIEKLKEFGYEDVTETKYWSYPTYSGTMRQELQKDTLDFCKKFGSNTITIGVENDRWCFDGLTEEDNVIKNADVWTNHGYNNESYHKAGAILSITEVNEGLILEVRKLNKRSDTVYTAEIKVTFDELDED